jgi:hypothetical protein
VMEGASAAQVDAANAEGMFAVEPT